MQNLVKKLSGVTAREAAQFGSAFSLLGEIANQNTVKVPRGFVIAGDVFQTYLETGGLKKKIKAAFHGIKLTNARAYETVSKKIQALIAKAPLSDELKRAVGAELKGMKEVWRLETHSFFKEKPEVALGDRKDWCPLTSEQALLQALRQAYAHFFSAEALKYRDERGLDQVDGVVAVGVFEQGSVVTSGRVSTLEVATGHAGFVEVESVYGSVSEGNEPDRFVLAKEPVLLEKKAIIDRVLGKKKVQETLVAGKIKREKVGAQESKRFSVSDEMVVKIAEAACAVEKQCGFPVIVLWQLGADNEVRIVHVRGERGAGGYKHMRYRLEKESDQLAQGRVMGQGVAHGVVKIFGKPADSDAETIVVARAVDASWDQVLEKAAAVVLEESSSYAVVRCRELQIPLLTEVANARTVLKSGTVVTVAAIDAVSGVVYKGRLPYAAEAVDVSGVPESKTRIYTTSIDAGQAAQLSKLPSAGVGWLSIDQLYVRAVKAHPLAFVMPHKLTPAMREKIEQLAQGYKNRSEYVVDVLAKEIARTATAFYGRPVLLHLSEASSDERRELLGGNAFEPKEDNPLVGLRGASRYVNDLFKEVVAMECAAIKRAHDVYGLTNIIPVVPFCRSLDEGREVLQRLSEHGLQRGKNGLQIFVTCDIPANVMVVKEFAQLFDGFSLYLQNLTQLALGVDRHSVIVGHLYNESDAALKKLLREVIQVARAAKRSVTMCDYAAVEDKNLLRFLVQEGIDGVVASPDMVYGVREELAEMERTFGRRAFSASRTIAAKTLSMAGVAGLMLLLSGYTCETVSLDKVKADMATEAEAKITAAKEQVRADLSAELAKKLQEQKTTYSDTGFVSLSVNYPAQWKVERGENTITFVTAEDNVMAEIADEAREAVKPEAVLTTSTWHGYEVGTFESPITAEGEEVLKYMLVYPDGYAKSKRVIRFSAPRSVFDAFVEGVIEFQIPKAKK